MVDKQEKEIVEIKYKLKQLELNALLEVTQAINANMPENSLYKIFQFILLANLNIKKLALYVFNDCWECKVNIGTEEKYAEIDLPDEVFELKDITVLSSLSLKKFTEFELVIPIAHKEEVLAYVFVGKISVGENEQREDILSFVRTLSNIILVAIENKKLAKKQLQQEALRKELEIARQVQGFLFPKSLPDNNKIKVEI